MTIFRIMMICAAAFCLNVIASNSTWAACSQFRLLPAFAIKQSTGTPVTIKISSRRGEVSGVAWYMGGDDFRRVVGSIEGGSFDGRVLKFTIVWSNSAPARYEGAIDQDGKLFGSARWTQGRATFNSIQTFECKA